MKIQNWQTIPDDQYENIYQQSLQLIPFKTSDSLHVYEEQYKIGGDVYRFISEIGGDIQLIQKFIEEFEI